MTDIYRWYARCMVQLGIDSQTEPERAEAAKDALACFADDPEWLAWLVMHSEWYLESMRGDEKLDNPLDQTANETATTNLSPAELESLLNQSGNEPDDIQFNSDPYQECLQRGVRYGKRLPYWFVDFYRCSAASCSPSAYEIWATQKHTPHFAQPDGEWASFDSVTIDEIPPETYIDWIVAAGRVKPPRDQKRELYVWMIGTQRAQESPANAQRLFGMLLSAVDEGKQSLSGRFAGWEVISTADTKFIRPEGGGKNYHFSSFQNDCTKLCLTRKSR
ncbi:hypothetical protein [Marinobacterium sediminicola]|uniref:Uncharacterized protein n=1 Tax=Marinobacterium sediminicola TaxID=518898 RepID=A0ABY1RXW6_9GAMM|nr:hypothetical protein [Marinobacterium sediminicola]ULG68553.1 hypothetical protein LN244_12725 [Marinobacterium sediminicola]SMR73065.1 hypothetical protein SAMN04487964_1034 [Marinobacterium sediminicola]